MHDGPARNRLGTRLGLTLALAAILPFALTVLIFSGREERNDRHEVMAQQQGRATALAGSVEEYIRLHQAAVSAAAAQLDILTAPLPIRRAELEAFTRSYPDLLSLALFASDGSPIVQSDDLTNTLSIAGYPVYEQARATGKPSLDVLMSPEFHQPVFALGAPIFDAQGEFAGIASGAVPSTRVAAYLLQRTNLQAGQVYLLDGQGRVIAHSDASLVSNFTDLSQAEPARTILKTTGASGSLSFQNGSVEQLVGYARVPGLNWVVVIERPATDALANVRASQIAAIVILLVGIALAFVGGSILAGLVTRPLAALASAAQAIAEDPAGAERIALPTSDILEIANLSSAFGEMRSRLAIRTAERERADAALREANEVLEERVQERTEELARTNMQLRSELAERQRAEAALGESEERYRNLFELAPMGILVHDGTHMLYANPAAAQLLGYQNAAELAGCRVLDLLHPDERAIVAARIRQCTAEKRSMPPLEERFLRRDGTTVDVVAATAPAACGGQAAVQLVLVDVTERKRVEREREEARARAETLAAERQAVLTSMTEGLIIGDLEGNVVGMNPEALRLLGFANPQAGQRHIAEYLEFLELASLDGRPLELGDWPLTLAMAGHSFKGLEAWVRRRDTDAAFIASFAGTQVRDASGCAIFAILTLSDITARKQAEREREELLSEVQAARIGLEQRVAERTRALDEANRALRQQGDRLEILYEVDQAILAAHSPEEIAKAALERLGRILPTDRASILLIDPATHSVRFLATSGISIPPWTQSIASRLTSGTSRRICTAA